MSTPVAPVLGHAIAAMGVRPLIKRVDPVADAVGEQREAARIVEAGDPVPQPIVVLERHVRLPGFRACLDGLGGGAVLQVGGLDGEVDLPDRRLDGAAVRWAVSSITSRSGSGLTAPSSSSSSAPVVWPPMVMTAR